MLRLLAPLMLLPLAATAEEPLGAAEFEAFVKGRTLTFSVGDEAYGIERYLPGRRVIWSFLDGRCEDGIWYEDDGAICFDYAFTDAPQCWALYPEGDGLRAVFLNDPAQSGYYLAQDGEEELICDGLGV